MEYRQHYFFMLLEPVLLEAGSVPLERHGLLAPSRARIHWDHERPTSISTGKTTAIAKKTDETLCVLRGQR
jgi:hypothetical protein